MRFEILSLNAQFGISVLRPISKQSLHTQIPNRIHDCKTCTQRTAKITIKFSAKFYAKSNNKLKRGVFLLSLPERENIFGNRSEVPTGHKLQSKMQTHKKRLSVATAWKWRHVFQCLRVNGFSSPRFFYWSLCICTVSMELQMSQYANFMRQNVKGMLLFF